VALIRADDVERVLRDLRKAGYLPVTDTAAKSSALDLSGKSFSKALTQAARRPPKSKREAASADPIDWSRVSRDDPGREPEPDEAPRPAPSVPLRPDVEPPLDAVLDRKEVAELMVAARSERRRVEVCFRPVGSENAVLRVMEPDSIAGEELTAFFPGAKLFQRLSLRRVVWARLTGDSFGK
jgi:hypothetical protein